MIRLIALDIDGTLTTADEPVTTETCAALARARDLGCRTLLISGRSRSSVLPVAEELPSGCVAGLGSYDGAVVELYPEREMLSQETIAPDVAATVMRTMLEMDLAPVAFPLVLDAERGPVYAFETHTLAEGWQKLNSERMRFVDDDEMERVLAAGVVTVSSLTDEQSARSCAAALSEKLGDAVSVAVSYSERYGGFFPQVGGPAATKAHALKALARRLDVELDSVLAIGDWLNDACMIESAGIGVAMAGAPAELCAIADWVTGSVEEHGVATAVDRCIGHAMQGD